MARLLKRSTRTPSLISDKLSEEVAAVEKGEEVGKGRGHPWLAGIWGTGGRGGRGGGGADVRVR